MQKFDLLSHLAVNLAQPIVICGPKGVGKTTFLRLLEARLAPLATVRYLVSTPGTSREYIFDELLRALNQAGSAVSGSRLTDCLAGYAKEHRNLVLLLDDAGALAPGLLDALWQFASGHPALRLILAMRSDEALQKSGMDRSAFGEAFVLDIPALSQDECASYAHRLAAKLPGSMIGQGMTKSFVKRLYSGSQGIPGKLIEILKSPHGTAKAAALTRFGWITGAGLLALAGVTAYGFLPLFSRQAPPQEKPLPDHAAALAKPGSVVALPATAKAQGAAASNPPAEAQAPPTAAANLAVPRPPASESEKAEFLPATVAVPDQPPAAPISLSETDAEKMAEDQTMLAETEGRREPPPSAVTEAPANAPDSQAGASSVRPEPADSVSASETKRPDLAAADAPSEKRQRSRSSEIVMDGLKSVEWLMQQNPEAYTLQIVAVSRSASVVKLAKQFPAGSELASFRSRKGGGDLYPLFFGIYPTLPAAKEAAAMLPASLGQPLPRQMKSIHQEIRRMMPRHAELGASADSPAR
ncbi:AAA family ATPase [Methylocaldum sp. MU1018]